MQSGPWEKPELIIRTAISKEKGQGQKVCGKYEHLRVLTWTNGMTTCSGRRHLLKVNLPYLESQQGETAINREMWQPKNDKRTNEQTHVCLQQTRMQTRNGQEENGITLMQKRGSSVLRFAPASRSCVNPSSRQAN